MSEFIGNRYVIPIRRLFPIWRSGFRFDTDLMNWVEDPKGWYPDWYRYYETRRIF